MMLRLSFFLILTLVLMACRQAAETPASGPLTFSLTSPAFEPGAPIPERYTCKGEDVSPPLIWSDPPQGTQSFILIMDDPDAPLGTWVHWIVHSIPAQTRRLDEAVIPDAPMAFGKNSWGDKAYGGPCPPSGTHRYYFKLYALDVMPQIPDNADKQAVEKIMQGHILAYGELMGTFTK